LIVLGEILILCVLTIEYLTIVGICEIVKELGSVLGAAPSSGFLQIVVGLSE
jgi:hypothetical protein